VTTNFSSHTRYSRADKLLANDGVIGGPLQAIASMQDLPTALQSHLYYVIFEHLMQSPEAVMQDIFKWLGLAPKPHRLRKPRRF